MQSGRERGQLSFTDVFLILRERLRVNSYPSFENNFVFIAQQCFPFPKERSPVSVVQLSIASKQLSINLGNSVRMISSSFQMFIKCCVFFLKTPTHGGNISFFMDFKYSQSNCFKMLTPSPTCNSEDCHESFCITRKQGSL